MSTYANLVFDLDGVVYLDGIEVFGAGATLAAASEAGCNVLFATNNASRPRADFVARIADITGYHATVDQVVSSAMAAASVLRTDECVLAVAGPGVSEAIIDGGARLATDWHEAETVVVGLDLEMTYQRLRDAALAIRNGARFIATNDDSTFPAPDGLWPGAGSSISFLTAATDRLPDVVAGKPNRPIRTLIAGLLDDGPTLVIGDRPETDLATGQAEGWDTVLVLTGVTSDPKDVPDEYTPTYVIPSISNLGDLIGL